jgi:hypothetical protein
MSTSTHLYGQIFASLRQHSSASDVRHLKTLAWMVSALLSSEKLSLSVWEPYVPSRATKAQSYERRWHRFCVEELFLDSKSGVFELEDSRLRCPQALERLYLVAAVALLSATTQGMAVQIAGLRQQVDPHWRRGLSYLKIGLRWLRGVLHKGRQLFAPRPLLPQDPQPCFASKKAEHDFYDRFWFSRIRSLTCQS